MSTVEKIKAELKAKKIPVSRMERDLGYGNGYISQLKKGTVPADRLQAIANYLGKPLSFFLETTSAVDEYGHQQTNRDSLDLKEEEYQLIQAWREASLEDKQTAAFALRKYGMAVPLGGCGGIQSDPDGAELLAAGCE